MAWHGWRRGLLLSKFGGKAEARTLLQLLFAPPYIINLSTACGQNYTNTIIKSSFPQIPNKSLCLNFLNKRNPKLLPKNMCHCWRLKVTDAVKDGRPRFVYFEETINSSSSLSVKIIHRWSALLSLMLLSCGDNLKHRHRRNVTSHHSFSLFWQF